MVIHLFYLFIIIFFLLLALLALQSVVSIKVMGQLAPDANATADMSK